MKPKTQLALALTLLALSAVISFVTRKPTVEARVWFYDESAGELFVAPQKSIPPIIGIDGEEMDAVRAVVVAPKGQCGKEDARRIAYLEKYSPTLKRQMELTEAAKAEGKTIPELLDRSMATSHRMVRTVDSEEWVSLATQDGVAITESWRAEVDADGQSVLEACFP